MPFPVKDFKAFSNAMDALNGKGKQSGQINPNIANQGGNSAMTMSNPFDTGHSAKTLQDRAWQTTQDTKFFADQSMRFARQDAGFRQVRDQIDSSNRNAFAWNQFNQDQQMDRNKLSLSQRESALDRGMQRHQFKVESAQRGADRAITAQRVSNERDVAFGQQDTERAVARAQADAQRYQVEASERNSLRNAKIGLWNAILS